MITPVTKNLLIYRGITYKFSFSVFTKKCCDGSGDKIPFDLTEYDAFMQIRKTECGAGEHELILDLNDPDNMIDIDPDEGKITITIPGEATKDIFVNRPLTYWLVLKNRETDETVILLIGSVKFVKPIVILP